MIPRLVDVGANLAHRRFRDDLPAVLGRAEEAGVETIVITGTSVAASRDAVTIASSHLRPALELRATAGIHPHEARTYGPDVDGLLERLAARREVVALGECGLDYDRDFSPRDAQRRAFAAQLDLAISLKKPAFLHERAAHDDFVAIVRPRVDRLVAAMVHCFTGSARELDAYLDMGLHVGITGYLCDARRGAHLGPLLARVPKGKLHVETDAPFLLPRDLARPPTVPGRNEPCLLPHVLAAVARARREDIAETAAHTSAASRAFFGLPG